MRGRSDACSSRTFVLSQLLNPLWSTQDRGFGVVHVVSQKVALNLRSSKDATRYDLGKRGGEIRDSLPG